MATHSSILAWKIPWMEEPGWAAVHGVAESDTTERFSLTYLGYNLILFYFATQIAPALANRI